MSAQDPGGPPVTPRPFVSPSRGPRGGLAAGLVGLAAVAALGAWVLQQARGPADPDLAEASRLAASGNLDSTLRKIEDQLEDLPENPRLRILAAELSLEKPHPEPGRALHHASQVRTDDAGLAARGEVARGKAYYMQLRYDEAEACWRKALKLDPEVPEAPWALLDLYYIQGRDDEARDLALRQHRIEPDPVDQLRFLVEILRQEAEPADPASVVLRFEPAVVAHPGDRNARLAMAGALLRSSRTHEGIEAFREVLTQDGLDVRAWAGLLQGLEAAGDPGRLRDAWEEVPRQIRADPRLALYEGAIAWSRGDRELAVACFRRAHSARPDDLATAYRLGRALRASGHDAEAAEMNRFLEAAHVARDEVRELYQQMSRAGRGASRLDLDLIRRIVENRVRLGRPGEADAWRRLQPRT